jgi:hypothetical protein
MTYLEERRWGVGLEKGGGGSIWEKFSNRSVNICQQGAFNISKFSAVTSLPMYMHDAFVAIQRGVSKKLVYFRSRIFGHSTRQKIIRLMKNWLIKWF